MVTRFLVVESRVRFRSRDIPRMYPTFGAFTVHVIEIFVEFAVGMYTGFGWMLMPFPVPVTDIKIKNLKTVFNSRAIC